MDDELAASVLVLLERAKQVVEGAGATPVAALLGDDLDVTGETVVGLLSGGNLDMTMLRTILIHALTDRAPIFGLQVKIADVPGKMAEIAGIIASRGANIQTAHHNRSETDLSVGEAHLVFRI